VIRVGSVLAMPIRPRGRTKHFRGKNAMPARVLIHLD
jgi:hypothetical protein